MKALMMSKKMVLHIFSRHYLIFYGHLESLWSFFTPTANEKIRYLRLLCSIFVVVLPPLVYLLAETWHWAICTHKMIFSFFRCLAPFPPLKQLRRLSLPTTTVIDSSSSPLDSCILCKTIYILLIQKYNIFSKYYYNLIWNSRKFLIGLSVSILSFISWRSWWWDLLNMEDVRRRRRSLTNKGHSAKAPRGLLSHKMSPKWWDAHHFLPCLKRGLHSSVKKIRAINDLKNPVNVWINIWIFVPTLCKMPTLVAKIKTRHLFC